MKQFVCFVALLATIALHAAPAPTPTIPQELSVEELFGAPTISRLTFSPDGRYIAALQPWEKRMNLIVVDLQKMQKTQLTSMKEENVADFLWASNSRLFFFMDDDGKESYRMFAINADGSEPELVASFRSLGLLGRIHGDDRHYVVAGTGYQEQSFGRQVAPMHVSRWTDVYYIDLKTGRAKIHAHNPGNFDDWIIDRAGVARCGIAREPGAVSIYYRQSDGAPWEKIATFRDGEQSWSPVGFDGDNRTLYVASNIGRKTTAVFKYDPDKRLLGELVHGDPTYDVESIVYNDALNRVVGVWYQGERPTEVWFDERLRSYQRALDAAFPETLISIREASADNSRLLVFSHSDREPGRYFIFDPKARKLEPIAATLPNIDHRRMGQVHPFAMTARDGLRLHGYLTLPVGREPKNLPLVVHPHGGPYGPRDNWGYDPEVQFYANRGFAVLQLNYRGSGGYGDWFERAGYRKWGLEMQDDLTDAVKWAIAQGFADPKRVVISGASYGGYATMAGLTFTPELYCAGINYVGVTDIMMLIDNPGLGLEASRIGEFWYRTRIGDPHADTERIKATSPVHFADRIRVPLLMGYGKNDRRVEIAHGAAMVRALKAAGRVEGRDFWFYVENREGHGFRREEARIAFYKHVDEFLKTQVLSRTSADEPGGRR